jgi:hypothetical protein
MLNDGTLQAQQEKSLLIVDDDRPFLTRVARAMEQRGYSVATAETVEDGIRAISTRPPAFAVIRPQPRFFGGLFGGLFLERSRGRVARANPWR